MADQTLLRLLETIRTVDDLNKLHVDERVKVEGYVDAAQQVRTTTGGTLIQYEVRVAPDEMLVYVYASVGTEIKVGQEILAVCKARPDTTTLVGDNKLFLFLNEL